MFQANLLYAKVAMKVSKKIKKEVKRNKKKSFQFTQKQRN